MLSKNKDNNIRNTSKKRIEWEITNKERTSAEVVWPMIMTIKCLKV